MKLQGWLRVVWVETTALIMFSPTECRQYAMICEEQARLAASTAVRKKMLDLAREWNETAERMQQTKGIQRQSSKQA